MANATLEERVANLEAEVTELRVQLKARKLQSDIPWWEKRAGAFKDDPMYDEAMRLGREYREAQRIEYEDEEDDVKSA